MSIKTEIRFFTDLRVHIFTMRQIRKKKTRQYLVLYIIDYFYISIVFAVETITCKAIWLFKCFSELGISQWEVLKWNILFFGSSVPRIKVWNTFRLPLGPGDSSDRSDSRHFNLGLNLRNCLSLMIELVIHGDVLFCFSCQTQTLWAKSGKEKIILHCDAFIYPARKHKQAN